MLEAAESAFRRRGGIAAYLVAGLSIVYAVVYLGFVRTDASNATASALAWALIAAGALAGALSTTALASFIGGANGTFLAALGVGYSLLAAAHGAYAAIGDAQGFADLARVGIYGWSYGGYMTLRCMLAAPDRKSVV